MDRTPTPPKRRQIDRAALTQALAEQQRRDAEAPPASLLTTMGAIRLLGDVVLDRKRRGWSDPMLVALLRKLGIEISAETLRVYRGRLRRERDEAAAGDAAKADTRTEAAACPPAPPIDRQHVDKPTAAPRERDPGNFSRTVRFDDGV